MAKVLFRLCPVLVASCFEILSWPPHHRNIKGTQICRKYLRMGYLICLYLSLSLYTSAVTYIIYDLNVRQNLIRSTAVFGAG